MVIGPDDAMCRAGRTFELGLGKNKVLRNPSVSRAAGRKAGQGQSAPAGICAAAKEGVGWVERGGDGEARRGSVHCETSVRSVCEQCRPSAVCGSGGRRALSVRLSGGRAVPME